MTEGPTLATWQTIVGRALLAGAGPAIVAMFCFVTASLIPFLKETYWAPIAAVVVLYPDRQATRKAGVERFFGTILGSLVGWGSAVLWHHHIAAYGVSVVVAVGLCHLLKVADAARLCAVTVTVITIIPHSEPPHLVALFRFIEVSYGVACALAYTALVDWVQHPGDGAAKS